MLPLIDPRKGEPCGITACPVCDTVEPQAGSVEFTRSGPPNLGFR